MKNNTLFFRLFLLISLLGSCAHSLSQADAVAQAKKILAKRSDTSFAYDWSKVTATLMESGNDISGQFEYRSIQGSYYYASSSLTMPVDVSSSSSKVSLSVFESLYEKDGLNYDFTDNGSGKYVATFASKADFSSRLTALEGNMHESITDSADLCYNFLDTFVENVSQSSSSSLSPDSSTKIDYSYASSGDGNLTLIMTGAANGSHGTMAYKATYAFNNYLPVSSFGTGTGKIVSSSTEVAISTKLDNHFDWGNCTPIYFDVADYSSVAS